VWFRCIDTEIALKILLAKAFMIVMIYNDAERVAVKGKHHTAQ
jgi:hypothetical protein